jgi:hypothetical protein
VKAVPDEKSLRQRLEQCPPGREGWKEYEDACIEALQYLFVPPLRKPHIQARTYSGIDRRDAVFPNWNKGTDNNNWGRIYDELEARMVLFEFKNYDTEEIGKDETNQTRNYLQKQWGKLAIMCCNKMPNEAAHIKRNSIHHEDDGKVILFVTTELLIEMLFIKERGEDPSDLIMDMIDRFYLQYE